MDQPNHSYDQLPYPNYVFAETHPGRIAANGRFFGLACVDPTQARVLEIGCAGGLNILSHAASLPSAKFVGIDVAAEQINAAEELRVLSGISNVEFLHKGLEELNDSHGYFDYIICHGVFAWIEENLQLLILKLCKERLSPNGIAFISYNALPGWHIQNILRDAMRFHTRSIEAPIPKVKAAKELLEVAYDLFPESAQPMLQPIIDHLQETPDNYLFHDHLGAENHPLYFSEFIAKAEKYDLMYLSDSDISSMLPKEFPSHVQATLHEYAEGSLSRIEQYNDFLRLRPFRKTLLCKNSVQVTRNINPHTLVGLSVSAKRASLKGEYFARKLHGGEDLSALINAFPRWMSVTDLLGRFVEAKRETVLQALFDLLLIDAVEIRADKCILAANASLQSKISPLLKPLARYGAAIPNLRSETVAISEKLRGVLERGEMIDVAHYQELQKLGFLREG